jgi:hypothetical protein
MRLLAEAEGGFKGRIFRHFSGWREFIALVSRNASESEG